MSRLWTSGFEVYVDTGNGRDHPDGNNVTNQALSRATTNQRSGNAALRLNSNGSTLGEVQFLFTGALDRWYYARVYLKIVTPISGSPLPIIRFGVASGTRGNVSLFSDSTVLATQGGAASAALNDGAYHRIEYGVKPSATQASRAWELRVDGVSISSGTNQTTESAAFTFLSVGITSAQVCDLYFDDVGLNDDQGSSQNSWCGDGKVVLLVPTADSAVGTGWTNDNAATSSLFNSVKATPPAGIADTTSGGGGHQIRNATSNANSNYDATMTTYTAAGIGSSDTINVVLPWISTGAPVVTSAKAGTVGVVSNPTIANVNLGPGGTAGAFWQGTAAGAYVAGWKSTPATTTYAPSVTVDTAPVMRVTQVTASTRIAMVCFMGIYVDYTPAGAPAPKSLVVPGNRTSRSGALPQRILR